MKRYRWSAYGMERTEGGVCEVLGRDKEKRWWVRAEDHEAEVEQLRQERDERIRYEDWYQSDQRHLGIRHRQQKHIKRLHEECAKRRLDCKRLRKELDEKESNCSTLRKMLRGALEREKKKEAEVERLRGNRG